MDRCALFVDAGYLLADGAMAVHGTRNRDSVSWDYPGLVRLLNEIAHDRTGLPLLRCYWYEATVEGRRNTEQDTIADIPGVKVRAARIRPGRREGVESYVQRDITTLARSGVLCEAVLVSGDEDMVPVVADVQDLGVRVSVVQVEMGADESTFARELRRECDDLIEVGATHLRPHVNLISGAPESATEGVSLGPAPLTNGHARTSDTDVNRHPVSVHPGESRMKPVRTGGGAVFGAAEGHPSAEGNAMEQLRAMQQSIAQRRTGDHLAPHQTQPPMEHVSNDAMGLAFPTGAQPAAGQPGGPPAPGGHTGAQPSHAASYPTGASPAYPMNPATGANPSHAAPQAPDQQTVRLSPQAYPPTGGQPSHAHHPQATPTPPEGPPPTHGPPGPEQQFRPNHDPRSGGWAQPKPYGWGQ
ncbi:NYN domain-containing protein [Spiractinospora alimapuensis]|uniref:NYN domain-containing protein n=1 Tax=Spiractinospora alimapuensis TaxID=2820884 RepID=UPI001F26DE86|nr:NYN domain-containing protein [Spiractinospora alimapuensis]